MLQKENMCLKTELQKTLFRLYYYIYINNGLITPLNSRGKMSHCLVAVLDSSKSPVSDS